YYSPYVYCGNNPVQMIDPSGRSAFLGGLLGSLGNWGVGLANQAANGGIKDFSFNLSTSFNLNRGSARNFSTTASLGGNVSSSGYVSLTSWLTGRTLSSSIDDGTTGGPKKASQNKSRVVKSNANNGESWDIDGNGKLWLGEANRWYREGGGNDINLPASAVDLSGIDPDLFYGMKPNGLPVTVQLLYKNFIGDGPVFGQLDLIYQGGNKVKIVSNKYDFDNGAALGHPWFESVDGFLRNVFTKAGEGVATGLWIDTGRPYMINFIGTATLSGYPQKKK
ncbi:hypothetical protein, partial [Arcticibacter tournemirensis]